MTKELHYTKAHITKIDKETGAFDVIASTGDVDRDREVIDPKGWELGNYLKNPVILWAHNYGELPIGVAETIEHTENGLVIKGRFASEEANPKAQQVKRLYEEGIQKAVSVGFIPLERDPEDESTITKAELLELSFVPVPANPNALALAKAKGIDMKKWESELFEKEKKADPEPAPESKDEKSEHTLPPVCNLNSDSYDPEKCAEAMSGRREVADPDMKQDETTIQTLILSKERFDSLEDARAWVTDHDFRADKVDETDNSFRFRQIQPSACQDETFRTIEITEGVSAVICRPKAQEEEKPKPKSKPDISQISESISERGRGTNTSDRAGGSLNDDEAVSDLSTTTIRELRKSTLEQYHACENILTITKRELDARKK